VRSDRIRIKRAFLLGAALLAILACTSQAKVIYVDDDANAPGNGTSWQNAYKYLQDALADANTADKPVEIRVAQGIYRPDRSSANPEGSRDREATFRMLSGVTLKGGYAGLGASDPNIRDVAKCESILSGDLVGDDVLVGDANDLVYDPNDGTRFGPREWCLMYEPTRRENTLHVVTTSGVDQTAILDGVTITAGNAFKPPYWLSSSGTPDDRGGGIANEGGSPELVGCTFSNNSAWDLGGGMYNARVCNPMLLDCRFIGNFVLRDGGAMSNGHGGKGMSGVQIEMTRCTFEANTSWSRGSAIFGHDSKLTAVDCRFTANTRIPYGQSAAVVNNGGDGIFNRCTFSGNQSTALEQNAGLALTDCTFLDNRGTGLVLMPYRDVTIERCSFTRNRWWRGGGIDGGGGNWTIRDCVFRENWTYGTGGAIRYDGDGYNPGCKLTVENCLFVGNVSMGGGAIYNMRIGPDITNCTFVGNRSPQGAVLLNTYGGSANLRNCILWANEAAEGVSVYLAEDSRFPSAASVSYSLVEGGQASIWQGPSGAVCWGSGTIDADPCFADQGYWDPNGTLSDPNDDFWVDGDYHLKSQGGSWDPNSQSWAEDDVTSPCIDTGDPNSPVGDEPQPNGGRINMGAYGGTAEASKSYFGGPVCETQIPGDINGDCRVDAEDLAILARNWLRDAQPKSTTSPSVPPGVGPRR
jgi:hypothetical protein